ncbi:MAG: universal stress protein [Muribaculaceae bacterium]
MRLITLAIHTYDRAMEVKQLLENEGIQTTLQNVNLEQPEVSSGVRVRIHESDLPLALRIVENPEIFSHEAHPQSTKIPLRSILVPTDFSEHSLQAAVVAVWLAASRNTDVTFLNAYIDPRLSGMVQLSDSLTYGIADAEDTIKFVNEANKRMADFVKRIKTMMKEGKLPVVRCLTSVVEGVPEDAIIEYSKLNSPYLVVMGTRTSQRKEKELIGSVTAEVLDAGHFSVLTVPESVDAKVKATPRNILFFSNLDQEDIIAMDTLYRYFSNSHAEVTIIHIPQRRRFTDKAAGRSAIALSEYCRKTFSHFDFQTVPISPKTAIEELRTLQAEHNYDLLVLPNRRKNALSRFFNPGLAHKILFEADIPMLVIPV